VKLPGLAARLEALLARHWWQPGPTWLAMALMPLAWLYASLARRHAVRQQARGAAARPLGVPVLVVGNVVVGGAGKTPTVVAVVRALKAAGYRPGVLSRGHGRQGSSVQGVGPDDEPREVGDEPLLIQRLTQQPVWVGADRFAAARALCTRHPAVDVLVSDDGLQHRALIRQAELIVFDRRGAGNGLLLPAGPLREALPARLAPHQRVLYTGGVASTALPGALGTPQLTGAWPLADWERGDGARRVPLSSLRGRPVVAAAGLAAPEKFYAMLEAEGLTIRRLPLPDHHDYARLPWPEGTPDVLITEKDAVKLRAARTGSTRVWVVPLDLHLPEGLVAELIDLLFAHITPRPDGGALPPP
jgi:tetraacyldisaccharide 4'-kinase